MELVKKKRVSGKVSEDAVEEEKKNSGMPVVTGIIAGGAIPLICSTVEMRSLR